MHAELRCLFQTLFPNRVFSLDEILFYTVIFHSLRHGLHVVFYRGLLVSTYVVCERLSVMYEPAGVVEILVQILHFTPIL